MRTATHPPKAAVAAHLSVLGGVIIGSWLLVAALVFALAQLFT